MDILEKLKQTSFGLTKILLCGFGVFSTFYMITEFTYFLSVPLEFKPDNIKKEPWLHTSWSLLVDMMLLNLFIVQHSLLASQKLKDKFSEYGLNIVYRSLYVIATATVIVLMVKNWRVTPEAIMWEINMNYKPVWWLFTSIHSVAWLVIYVGNICTDVTELLGIKQIYYSIVNLPDPNLRKSPDFQRLNSHIRHPSFLAFLFIFWTYPVMSMDRMLLYIILSLYMYIAWNSDERDYYYHKYQYERKHFELGRMGRFRTE